MKKISIAEPVTATRKIKILENNDPLVDLFEFCPALLQDRPRFKYRRERWIRKGVAERLCEASAKLPKGYKLAIIEGWRAPFIQKRMYESVYARFRERNPDWSDVKMRRVVNRFTAPIDRLSPPPHTTGGAVDLLLAREDGSIPNHCAPYEPSDEHGFPFAAPNLREDVLEVRGILAEAITPTGLTNYPSEYWHWSYGDQGWAYRGGHPHALYGPIEPPDWSPDPNDLTDAPLEWEEDPAS